MRIPHTYTTSTLYFQFDVIFVRIIILPCPIWTLASLGPHGLIEPHVPITRVWGTLVEANFH